MYCTALDSKKTLSLPLPNEKSFPSILPILLSYMYVHVGNRHNENAKYSTFP